MSDGARLPAFQFYPADWQGNSNLRRCSHEEKGIWIDMMCILHDQAEYGIVRWTLDELANAVGAAPKKVRALIAKGVLKGADRGPVAAFVYTPRSGRRLGSPVTLIPAQDGPLWYSSRMVKDAYVRRHSGSRTRFRRQGEDNDDTAPRNISRQGAHKSSLRRAPPRRRGDDQGDGASSSSSSSSTESPLAPPKDNERGSRLPDDWTLDERLTAYCVDQGYTRHQAAFIAHRFENHWRAATGRTARKRDWRRAFMVWVTGERRAQIVDGAAAWKAPNGNGADEPADWPRRIAHHRETGEWLDRWGPPPGQPGYLGPPSPPTNDLFPPEVH